MLRCERFSLYPNGAFMVCEDASEFDENLPERIPVPPETAEAPKPVIAIVQNSGAFEMDPVAKLSGRLRDVYQRHIVPLLSMDYTMGSPEDASHKVEQLMVATSESIRAIRAVLVKYGAIAHMMDVDEDNIAFEPAAPYMREFIMRADEIRRLGAANCTYQMDGITSIHQDWALASVIAALISHPEVLERPVTGTDGIVSGRINENPFSSFNGLIDFMQCFFEDPERLARLEEKRTITVELESILRHGGAGEVEKVNIATVACDTDVGRLRAPMLRYLSFTLSDVLRRCYDLGGRIEAGDISGDVFSDRFSPLLSRVVNAFAIGTMVALHFAYNIRFTVSKSNAIRAYTDNVRAMLANK